jgi:hypothetical protein
VQNLHRRYQRTKTTQKIGEILMTIMFAPAILALGTIAAIWIRDAVKGN